MRCAIRRLTSLGVSPAEPRKARDSEETHAITSAQGVGPPSAASLQDKRAEGGSQSGHLGGGILEGVLTRLDFVKNASHGWDSSGEE